MKRLTHMELAALQGSAREHVLWEHAIPLVKLTIKRMIRNGSIRRQDSDDDLLQEGMLIAGEAIKTWRPIECAFSTHIVNRVRSDLIDYQCIRPNGGIGGKDQTPTVLSVQDKRDDAPRDEDDENDDDDGTFEATLSYEGLVQANGQLDGTGIAPQGYSSTIEEVERLTKEQQIATAVASLSEVQRDIVRAVMGLNGRPETIREYAARVKIPRSSAADLLTVARKRLGQKLSKSRS